jgi:protein TonB
MSAALHGEESRVFRYAVLASIALHGLMLFSFSMQDASRRAALTPAPLVARLVQPPPAPAVARPEPAAPAPAAKPPPVAKPAPAAKPPPAAKAAPKAPSPAPAPPPAASTPPAPPAPAPSEPAPPAAPAPQSAPSAPAAPAAPPAAAPARPGTEVDADSVGRFRLQVIEAAGRFKRYPRSAMDNNWEGRADVRVTFGADGRRSSIVVVRSSGHEILDKQALDTVTKAFVPVPPALRGKEFAFEIPVIFNLKDARSG